ncbi:phosphopantetheine-binding protein, partial [Myxococcus sp. AM010]|uniref:phosphopantetheine-binding protein n=2 Tax=unclassified Myxococcus TaxID=2648731 RepID=UPI00180481F5
GLGLGAYAAANAFLDAFAVARSRTGGTRWLSTNWDGWPVDAAEGAKAVQTSIDQFAMTPDEAVEAFRRVVEAPLEGQVLVSTGNLDARVAQWVRREGAGAKKDAGAALHSRPALGTEYVAPTDDVERALVRVWQEQLGLEQLGIHDNFFDLGGNSLLWLKIVGRMKRELGRDVPLTSVFEAPTVATLAKKLGQGPAPAENPAFESSQSRGAQRRERRSRRE